jgi:DNA helicase II / ATP-dependent DNA helicase PcrA
MTISEPALERIREEENTLKKTIDSLRNSLSTESRKFHRLAKEARSLTSQIVTASRDLDKQMLANDESVSHALSNRAKDQSDTIEELLESPYFARIVLEEDSGSSKRLIEYKLGKKSHPDSNIIDWKNAPLAKLFYEYEEGESYLEDIRDRERSGTILRKHKVKIKASRLDSLECIHGKFKKNHQGTWEVVSTRKVSSEGKFELPSILSYITAEQFRLITEDTSRPVILHGIAGSGKTSVALHRLTWQLSHTASPNALILTPTEILARYIKNTLEQLDVSGVSVLPFGTWLNRISRESTIANAYHRKLDRIPPYIARVKSSLPFIKNLNSIMENHRQISSVKDCEQIVTTALSDTKNFIHNDTTNLINDNDLKQALNFTRNNYSRNMYDYCDELAFLLIMKYLGSKEIIPSYTHLFLDEFQDSSPLELALISSCVKDKNAITITGDIAQHTRDSGVHHASLEALLVLDRTSSATNDAICTLSISHRSSLQIMKYADYILGTQRTTDGRPGKPPLLILCDSRTSAIKELISWAGRVSKNFSGDPVLVITDDNNDASELVSHLQPAFGNAVSLLREAPRSTDGLILVAPLSECKGLEFPHVLLWDISDVRFKKTSEHRRRLYLAATRAEEHLALLIWGKPSGLLPPLSSSAHRIYDTRADKIDN